MAGTILLSMQQLHHCRKIQTIEWKLEMRRHPCLIAWKARNDVKQKLLKKKSAESGSESDGKSDSDGESDSDGGSDEDNAPIDKSDDNSSSGGELNGGIFSKWSSKYGYPDLVHYFIEKKIM